MFQDRCLCLLKLWIATVVDTNVVACSALKRPSGKLKSTDWQFLIAAYYYIAVLWNASVLVFLFVGCGTDSTKPVQHFHCGCRSGSPGAAQKSAQPQLCRSILDSASGFQVRIATGVETLESSGASKLVRLRCTLNYIVPFKELWPLSRLGFMSKKLKDGWRH